MAEIREDTAGTHMGTWQGLNMQFFKFVGGKCVLLQVSWVTSAICCHVPRYIRGLQVQHVIMSLVYPCPYCFRNPVSLSIPCYIGTRSHELIYISNLDLNRNKNANLEERTIRKKNSLSKSPDPHTSRHRRSRKGPGPCHHETVWKSFIFPLLQARFRL